MYIENLPFVSQALSSRLDAQKLEDSVLSALKEKRAVPKKRFAAFGYGSAAALLLVAGILVMALRNPAVQDKAESLANGKNLASQDSISDTSPLEDACDDSISAVTPEADMGGNLPAMMKAPTNSESEKTTQSQSYDTLTTEADKSDEAFGEHLRISNYSTFLASNALHPVYPQILVGEENKELCYQNIIAENSLSPLIEEAQFYFVNLPLDSMTQLLMQNSITDYTVILPDDASNADGVYMWFE